MNKINQLVWVFSFVIIVLSVALLAFNFAETPVSAEYLNIEDFAKCLTEKGATMYGAAWCSHCQAEKSSFGKSFQYVNYVECPDNIEICTAKGIMGYPTWIFGGGEIAEGRQGLERLSEKTGCELKK